MVLIFPSHETQKSNQTLTLTLTEALLTAMLISLVINTFELVTSKISPKSVIHSS
jgi:hypothetical protein